MGSYLILLILLDILDHTDIWDITGVEEYLKTSETFKRCLIFNILDTAREDIWKSWIKYIG